MLRFSKLLMLICLASGLFLTAVIFQWASDGINAVSGFAADLSAKITALEEAQPQLPASAPWDTWQTGDLVAVEKRAATFLGFANDSLVAWTKPGNFSFPDAVSISKAEPGLTLNGDRELRYLRKFPAETDSSLLWVGYLLLEIPQELAFSKTSGEAAVAGPDGQILGYLQRVSPFQTAKSRNISLVLWLVAMVFVFLVAATVARNAKRKFRSSPIGFFWICAIPAGAIAVSYFAYTWNSFFQPVFFQSFPIQLALSVTALLMAVYWQNEIGRFSFAFNILIPALLAAGLSAVSIYGAELEGELWGQWPFWNAGQWGRLIAYGLLWTAFFLSAYRIYGDWVVREQRFYVRATLWLTFSLGAGLLLGIYTDISVLRFVLFALGFGFCMDYFIISRVGDLTGFGFWLFVLSLGAAIFTIDPEFSSITDVFNRFSYLFVILLTLLLILMGFHSLSRWLEIEGPLPWKNADSLRTRLQRLVISVTLFSLGMTSIVAYIFVEEDTSISFSRTLSAELTGLALSWKSEYDNDWPAFAAQVKDLEWDLLHFDKTGRLKNVALGTTTVGIPSIQYMHPLAKLVGNNRRPVAYRMAEGYRILYRKLSNDSFLGLRVPEQGLLGRTPGLINFLRLLTNVCVFLFLLTGVISILLANSLVEPLVRLGKKLRTLSLESNEPLEWNRQDEIGSLVEAYNQMIGQLSERTDQLRRSEREGAWREMAKQVAHEIKNPLTPMKLTLQHLLRVRQADPRRAEEMMDQVAKSLVAQIDDLAGIATAFSNFAQMPQAVNEVFSLNDLCKSIAQLYSGHDAGFSAILCEDELLVDADPSLLRRALTNLIENGLQAVPTDRKAVIRFTLEKRDKQAQIRVSDNGEGIPEEIRTKIFQPNFTTKGSGMGLGLAMTQNIVTNAGGKIGFETEQGKGTEFWITLPCL